MSDGENLKKMLAKAGVEFKEVLSAIYKNGCTEVLISHTKRLTTVFDFRFDGSLRGVCIEENGPLKVSK